MQSSRSEPKTVLSKVQASVQTTPLMTASYRTPSEWLRIWDTDLSFQRSHYVCRITTQDDLQVALDNLPSQVAGTIRFYEWTPGAYPQQIDILADNLSQYAHRSSALFHTATAAHGESHVRKPIPIMSQWLESEREQLLYDALVIDLQHNGREREAVADGESIGGYASKEHGHFRSSLKCCSIDNNRLIVMSSIDVHGSAPWLPAKDINPAVYLFSPLVTTGGFDMALCRQSRRLAVKLLVLRFFQVHFHLLQEESFHLLEMVHLESHAKSRIAYDILCGDLEKLHYQVSHMIQDVEFVIGDVENTQDLKGPTGLVEYIHWSRYQLNVARENLSQALKSQQRYHNLFEREQSVSEAQSLKRLTILAAIFLPLSLSSGILSMGTRFKDLHDKLFDFIGVSVLIGAVTIGLYMVIKLFFMISRRYHALQKDYAANGSRWKRMVATTDRVLAKIIPLAAVVAITASFMVGMLIDDHAGDWRIGVIFGSTIAAVLVLLGLTALIRRTNRVKAPELAGIHQATCPQCFPK